MAAVTEQQQADARTYMIRKGHGDLLDALGLAGAEQLRGWKAFVCPTCSRPAGSACRADEGRPLTRPHTSRRLLAESAEHERQAAGELLSEILDEATT